MKKQSKVEIAREIRDKNYVIRCPYSENDCPDKCGYKKFCLGGVSDSGEMNCLMDHKKVDNYIKRYDRKKSLTTEDDVLDELENLANKELNANEPLPEPVPIAEIISNIETEKTYWTLSDDEGLEIFKVYLDEGITDVTKETFEDSRKAGVPWKDVYRTLADAVRIAESRGWK